MNAPLHEKDTLLIKRVVDVLADLKEMDEARIHFLLTQVRLVKPYFPREMLKGVESLEADFTLVLAFIEQAKLYDRGDDAETAYQWMFGKDAPEKRVQGNG